MLAPPAKDVGAGLRACVALLALLGLLAACRGPRTVERSALWIAITGENQRLVDLFRAGDLLGVADLYDEEAEIHAPDGTRKAGREEIDEHWSAIESPVAWRLEARTIGGSEALAYETGTARMTTRQGEALVTAVTHFLLVWRRDAGGTWRILLDAQWPQPTD
ncbi:MAG TPA: DUF4440 domain-containing protein [Planctomycetota bacterium]